MKGFQIDFIPKRHVSFRFAPLLYGRICLNIKKNNRYWYYVPGILDNIPFFKINNRRIFVKSVDDINFNLFDKYCISYKITVCEKDDNCIFLRTGRELIRFKSKEKGVNIHDFEY